MGFGVTYAGTVRGKMVAAGILRLERSYVNNVPSVRSWLTPAGLEAADHLRKYHAAGKQARDSKKKDSD